MRSLDQPLPASFIRPVLLQEQAGRRIRCMTCERRCELIPDGVGWCQTRRHQDGTLVTLIYGAVSSLSANPIEKKPVYHFYPGTHALTSGPWSCNFGCPWCQNHHISKTPPGHGRSRFVSPEEFVTQAISLDCQGTSISFNEPTLSLEWSLDVFRPARAQGLYNTYVSNGYMTPEALNMLVEAGLDAMNVDTKGDAEAVRRYCICLTKQARPSTSFLGNRLTLAPKCYKMVVGNNFSTPLLLNPQLLQAITTPYPSLEKDSMVRGRGYERKIEPKRIS